MSKILTHATQTPKLLLRRQHTGRHRPGGALSELGLLHTYERYQAGGEQFVGVQQANTCDADGTLGAGGRPRS